MSIRSFGEKSGKDVSSQKTLSSFMLGNDRVGFGHRVLVALLALREISPRKKSHRPREKKSLCFTVYLVVQISYEVVALSAHFLFFSVLLPFSVRQQYGMHAAYQHEQH